MRQHNISCVCLCVCVCVCVCVYVAFCVERYVGGFVKCFNINILY